MTEVNEEMMRCGKWLELRGTAHQGENVFIIMRIYLKFPYRPTQEGFHDRPQA